MFDLTVTFDNGPEPSITPGVLDVLVRRGVRTTFFVIGNKLASRDARACAERAHAEGHWIGNHTWTHSRPLGENRGAAAAELEIARTQAEIGALSHPDRLFRPTGGGGHLDRRLLSPEAAALLEAGRYTCVLWNAVPRDWADPEGWVETAFAQVARQPWTLMALHDVPNGVLRHLDRFLAEVIERGGRLRQDFPASCLPITRGRVTGPLKEFVSAPPVPTARGKSGSLG
jgi:peptidoglycan-N-acetylglucosamine deacetylase